MNIFINSIENFKHNCPTFFKEEIETGNVEIIQLVEFEYNFALLTYDKTAGIFYFGTSSKNTNEDDVHDNYREIHQLTSDYLDVLNRANRAFIDLLDDLT